jgi:Rod binding domain-containing protein
MTTGPLSSARPALPLNRAAGTSTAFAAAAPAADDEQLRRHVQTFVGQAFFGTLLKQMRESPFRSDLFSGGNAGQAYDGMYHQMLSERMGNGVGAKLVNAIMNQIQGRSAYRRTTSDPAPRSEPRFSRAA